MIGIKSNYLQTIYMVLFCSAITFLTNDSFAENPLSQNRQAELDYILKHDCGSCHGLSLNGGLGPALTPTALKHKSADYLKIVIKQGLPSTAMPPWQNLLNDKEIDYLVDKLKFKLSKSLRQNNDQN